MRAILTLLRMPCLLIDGQQIWDILSGRQCSSIGDMPTFDLGLALKKPLLNAEGFAAGTGAVAGAIAEALGEMFVKPSNSLEDIASSASEPAVLRGFDATGAWRRAET